jgi:hypothetical protein
MNTSIMPTDVADSSQKADLADPPGTPTEALIPEARRRQRGRYVRTAVVVTLCAFLLAGLIAAAVALWGGTADGTSQPASPSVSASAAPGRVDFRPVLCAVPGYRPGAGPPATLGPSSCSAASELNLRNLDVRLRHSAPAGFTSANVPPDAALAGTPSTKPSADRGAATVLLPMIDNGTYPPGYRYLLGPVEMTSRAITSATVTWDRTGQWVVDFSTSSSDAPLWDKVVQENFHRQVAIDLNGLVYSAPLLQPAQSSFSSFEGRGEISGGFTKAEATRLAKAMDSGRR